MKNQRLLSLDVFRGLTILLMTMVNNPGSWSNIYPILAHADWNGCTLADLVFPFFILILGMAIPFAMPVKTIDSNTITKILVRSLRIFCLGFFLFFFGKINYEGLDGFPLIVLRLTITVLVCWALLGNFSLPVKRLLVFSIFIIMMLLAFNTEMFAEIRIPGVLQRIGIVYFAVAILYLFFNIQNQIIIVVTLLIGYYLLMAFVDVPGIGAANFDKATNLSAWVDGIIFKNHMYSATKTWDPEGSLSTLPAIANGLLGCLLGQFIIKVRDKNLMVKQLSLIGVGLIFLGLGWNVFFPINKALWSSSYVFFTAGLGSVILALLYYIIDIRKKENWSKVFVIWGVNPMIVFFFSGIIPRVLGLIKFDDPNNLSETINLQSYLYKNYIAAFFTNPMTASLAGSLIYVMIWTFILWIFYKPNLIFKV